jgi:hypothetical protein
LDPIDHPGSALVSAEIFGQSAGGTYKETLPAGNAFISIHNNKPFIFFFTLYVQDPNAFDILARGNAAPTRDTPFRPVADECCGVGVVPFFLAGLKRRFIYTECVYDILKIAFPGPVTNRAVKWMVLQDLFQVGRALLMERLGISGDNKAVGNGGAAGTHRLFFTLNLNNAHIARLDGRQPLVVTENGDIDTSFFGGLEYRSPCGDLNLTSVDR